ncbi:MAG: hypothetical protein HYY93_00935 [Planctomycetes bacterium]|nr:hypothetical protein [Planctomycetota bacterium]
MTRDRSPLSGKSARPARRPRWAPVVAVLVLAAGCAGSSSPRVKAPPAAATALPERAVLEQIGNVPVYHVYGTPREMGRQAGAAMRDDIITLRDQYLLSFASTGERREYLRRGALSMEKHIPSPYLEEMHGLAEGAGLPYEDILLANTFLDVARLTECSTFVVPAERSADGEALFGRNLDFADRDCAHRFSRVVVYHPAAGRPFLAVTWPGMIGVLSGMNEDGLACAVMNVYGYGDSADGMPYTLQFRRILEEAGTTAEAIRIGQSTPRTCGNNLMVCDATGAAAVLEETAKQCEVRRREGEMVIWSTNHFRSKSLFRPWPCARYAKIEKMLAAKEAPKKVDDAHAHAILKAVAQKVKLSTTLQSMVFRPASRRLDLAIGELPATNGTYVRLDGRALMARVR